MGETAAFADVIQEEKKPYEFRKLSSQDVFPMFKIISKIGLNEFTSCFEKESIKSLVSSLSGKQEGDSESDSESYVSIAGISVALEIASVICGNLPKCENDIYQLLSQVSNLSIKEIKAMDFVVFTEMVIDFIKKEEFKDFIKVVSKLFK